MHHLMLAVVLMGAAFIYSYVLLGRRNGYTPFKGKVCDPGPALTAANEGRVDAGADAMVWYEAENALQIPHVKGAWDRRLAVMEAEERLFMVPGRGGCTTWDDLDTWRPLAKGLSIRSHLLRIVHNHWRHDMDNDAIAIEFASREDRDAFLSRVPAEGPKQFVFADMLSPEGRAQLEGLIGRNRSMTEQEAA